MDCDAMNTERSPSLPNVLDSAGQSTNTCYGNSESLREGDEKIEDHESLCNSNLSKVCRVCSDKAYGYNFNVVTCESCKAFFRRNALKQKEFRCAFNEKCEITVISRRFCQKCRLRKCFEVGMKKEAIMTEEDLAKKRHRLTSCIKHTKRLKFDNGNVQEDDCKPVCTTPNEDMRTVVKLCDTVQENDQTVAIPKQLLVKLISQYNQDKESDAIKTCLCKCRCGALAPDVPITIQLCPEGYSQAQASPIPSNPIPSAISENKIMYSETDMVGDHLDVDFATMMQAAIFSEVMGSQHSPFSSSASVVSGSKVQSSGLTERETRRMEELLAANEVMKEPLNCGEDSANDHPSLTDVINMTDIAIRRIIKMSKKIAAFRSLCQEDQIALLKGGCTELMILRGVMAFDPSRCSWQGPGSLIKLDVLKDAKGNVYEQHIRFLTCFDPSWRNDDKIMLLLGAITLFDANRANVTYESGIKVEQQMYYSLLKRYLDSKYDCPSEAEGAYENLKDKLVELSQLNETAVRIFMQVNPKQVQPLLIEMFDLK